LNLIKILKEKDSARQSKMDLSTEEEGLHYDMLRYIYNERKFGRFIFVETWQNFIDAKQSKHTAGKTARELKQLYLTQLYSNAANYNKLTKDQKAYLHFSNFEIDDSDDESAENNIVERGKDYDCWKSQKSYTRSRRPKAAGSSRDLRDIFSKPTAAEEEETKINVIDDHSNWNHIRNMTCWWQYNKSRTFQEALVPASEIAHGLEMIPVEEVLQRLKNRNFLSDIDTMADEIPQRYVDCLMKTQVGKALSPLELQEEEEEEELVDMDKSLDSLMIAPSDSSLLSSTRRSSMMIPSVPFSSGSSNIMTRSRSEVKTPSTFTLLSDDSSKARKRDAVVQRPATNEKMEKFAKRLRSRRNI
jgi:hypothetical protein